MNNYNIPMRENISKTLFERVSSVLSGNMGIEYFMSLYRNNLPEKNFNELISCISNGPLTQEIATQTINALYTAEQNKKDENNQGHEIDD